MGTLSPRIELAVLNCPHGGDGLCRMDVPATPASRDRCLACVERNHPELCMEAILEPEIDPVRAPDGEIDPEWHARPVSPVILNRDRGDCYTPSGLDNAYAGQKLFVVGGGPSLADVDVAEMHRTRACILAVNNAGAIPGLRPHFWTCTDGGDHFHPNIWTDPAIRKIVPMGVGNDKVRRKREGQFTDIGLRVRDCPSTHFFELGRKFDRHRFLPESCVTWGNPPGIPCSEGHQSGRSVMLVAMKLAFVLGFSEVFLVGVDFRMDQSRPYAFPQEKNPVFDADGKQTSDPVGTNNRSYGITSDRLRAVHPYMRQAGMTIWNANPESRLDVYPRIPYCMAIQRARVGLELDPDLSGWY